MILTTTNTIEGKTITSYNGIVVGEAIMGANIVRDLFARVTDIVGGRSGQYENKLRDAREAAMQEMREECARVGGDAVVGIDIDYEIISDSMMMVSVSGTSVTLE
ncbi:heavy metal-binding domain-containing protein [Sulfitobacter sp. S190]|uniref:heavy metal-binding domain-containing protein n=1 Tax=Sulfitobacter sp. S190 TaxID=2867022 RepID=UPI0021A802D0|nr:heavy metal-binding domain-containing protein [Sulfitobacter sp. S190]UWR23980.1 heavy metal-binding domain-containing protein [Sulfitobacter sp. S190]